MSNPDPTNGQSPFDTIRHEDEQGEWWSARELAEQLGYKTNYRNFVVVIERAKRACENSDNAVSDHFAESRNMVSLGSGAEREVDDYRLTRYACYLVAQNADPQKRNVARAQSYFAVRTHQTPNVHNTGMIHYIAGRQARDMFLQTLGIAPEDLPRPTKSYAQIVHEEYERIQRNEEDELGLWTQQLPDGDDEN